MKRILLAAALVFGVISNGWAFSLQDTLGVWSISHISPTSGRVITDTFEILNFQTIEGVQFGSGAVGTSRYPALSLVNANGLLEIGFTAHEHVYIYELDIIETTGAAIVGAGYYGSAPVGTTVLSTHTATAQRLSTWRLTSGVQLQQHALRSEQANEQLEALADALTTFSSEQH